MKSLGKFIGREKLKRKLKRIPEKIRLPSMAALVEGAEDLARFQRNVVPFKDGTLHDSIKVKQDPSLSKVSVVAGDGEAFYARFVEFGTPNAPARPFFFPTYRAFKKPIKSKVRRASRKAAKQVAKS